MMLEFALVLFALSPFAFGFFIWWLLRLPAYQWRCEKCPYTEFSSKRATEDWLGSGLSLCGRCPYQDKPR